MNGFRTVLALFALSCASVVALLFAQTTTTPGTVVYSGPAPAKLVASTPETPPTVSCTITGNAVPATAVNVACTVAGVTIPPYEMPLKAGQAYTFQQNFGADAVTVQAVASSTGAITVNATANGSPQQGGAF